LLNELAGGLFGQFAGHGFALFLESLEADLEEFGSRERVVEGGEKFRREAGLAEFEGRLERLGAHLELAQIGFRHDAVILERREKSERQNAAGPRGFRYAGPMSTSIEALTSEIRAFRDARDWLQFHNPKELAVAITAEAGELLQHFVWQSSEQSNQRVIERLAEIESEIADVAMLLFELADNCGIDLAAAMRAKLARNEERYPVAKARGSNKKYNEL